MKGGKNLVVNKKIKKEELECYFFLSKIFTTFLKPGVCRVYVCVRVSSMIVLYKRVAFRKSL